MKRGNDAEHKQRGNGFLDRWLQGLPDRMRSASGKMIDIDLKMVINAARKAGQLRLKNEST